nr:PIF-3 [Menippe mercenaria nudivirus]
MSEQKVQDYSYSLIKKPTYYAYVSACGFVILCFVILTTILLTGDRVTLKNETADIRTKGIFSNSKQDCSINKVYCFTDADCNSKCSDNQVSCMHGACSTDVVVSGVTNECDPSKGVVGYLVGNTALGTYSYICKSVDPAIAISVKENRMCYGDDSYTFDYLQQFPSRYACDCTGKTLIPATSQKRAHVECDVTFHDLVE